MPEWKLGEKITAAGVTLIGAFGLVVSLTAILSGDLMQVGTLLLSMAMCLGGGMWVQALLRNSRR